MPSAPYPSALDPVSQIARAGKIVVCLSAEEMQWFFPDPAILQVLPNVVLAESEDLKGDAWEEFLQREQPSVIVSCWSTPRIPVSYATAENSSLRYVCHLVGSVRPVVSRALIEHGLLVSNWGLIAASSVAEHALLLILSALRRSTRWRSTLLAPYEEQTRHRIAMRTKSLVTQRVGIHGFGGVARELVRFLRPFNVEIFAYSEGVPVEFIQKHGVTACRSLEELFRRSTVLVECEALTQKTEKSVTGELLALLPPDATFVNVGRGRVVDENALIMIVRQGRIRAALDVFAEEPLPHDSELLTLDEAVLSPHIAGPTHDLFVECAQHALRNLAAFGSGEPVAGRITLVEYDRAT